MSTAPPHLPTILRAAILITLVGWTSLTLTLAEPSASKNQPESTRRMIHRLTRIRERADPRSMPFLPDRQISRLQTALTLTTNAQQQLNIRFNLSNQQLQAGKTSDALETIQAFEKQLAEVNGKLPADAAVELRLRKANAYLRLGEQENCLANHTAASCLFPIESSGHHVLPRGSRSAIPLLTDHLKEFPDDLGIRWLLNIAAMTLGEWPDKVPAPWVIPPKVFDSEYKIPRFPDIAGSLGLDVDDLAGGCILDDFNNDGFLDVMASAWGLDGQLRLFINDGKGSFAETTESAGLIGLVSGVNIQQTDYNNDGWIDVWVPRGAWLGKAGRIPNSLLRNNGDGTFTDVTEEAGLLSEHPTQASTWFDYDGDGWLDVFIGNETVDPEDADPCELFHNSGNGTFTECAAVSGVGLRRYVKGVACADYDRDGRPDLYLSCVEGPNVLLHNDGPLNPTLGSRSPWRFSDVSRAAGVADTVKSFATWFFDYDNDGYDDLIACGYRVRDIGDIAADYLGLPHEGTPTKLYHNNGNGTFTDVSVAMHMNRMCLTMGCNFGDLDNDGWLDMYMATGNPDLMMLIPNRMFRNAEGRFFQEVTTSGGFGHLQKGHGVAFADFDEDGDQDVYAVMGGAVPGDNYRNALFLNPGSTNHWLKLKLEGTQANRAAIGSKIQVNLQTPAGPRRLFKTVNSGASFGSNPLRQELGLGNATSISSIEVTWSGSGTRQVFTGIELDHSYRLKEGIAEAVAIRVSPIPIDVSRKRPHMHRDQAAQ